MKKTALVLSGGGSRGAYEIGVWKALKELDVEIDMVFGTSVGAINGAMVAQDDLDIAEKLWKQIETSMIFDIDTDQPPQAKREQNALERNAGCSGSGTETVSDAPGNGVSAVESEGETAAENQRGHGDFHGSAAAVSRKLYDDIADSVDEKLEETEIAGLPAKEAIAYAREIVLHGGAGTEGLRQMLDEYIDEERVRRSGVRYGLVVTGVEFPVMHGQYMLADDIPSGRLIDYITASASCFPAARRYVIEGRSFIDGGYTDNMPVIMALQQGAERIFAVDLHAAGIVRGDTVKQAQQQAEFRLLESSWDLGSFLTFDKDNIARIMRLGYLDMMKAAGRFDGRRYTFADERMTDHDIMGAESAAEIFGLDPLTVYDRHSVIKALEAELDGKHSGKQEFVLHIAENLGENEAGSPYIRSGVYDILEEQVRAANFLLKSGLAGVQR